MKEYEDKESVVDFYKGLIVAIMNSNLKNNFLLYLDHFKLRKSLEAVKT